MSYDESSRDEKAYEIKNKEILANLNTELNLNYFPNDQTKHIDYVIYYNEDILESNENSRSNRKILKREEIRNKFLNQLKAQEGFEVQRIVKKNDDDELENYLLLHCSLDRLMQEAERMQLVLPLKDLSEPIEPPNSSCHCCFKMPVNYFDYASAPFETDIKFIFENFEAENRDCKGFKNSIRSLLVDNILRNMSFEEADDEDDLDDGVARNPLPPRPKIGNNHVSHLKYMLMEKNLIPGSNDDEIFSKARFSGLPYMLDKEYFNEAFILQEESGATKEFNKVLLKLVEESSDDQIDREEMLKYVDESKRVDDEEEAVDARSNLTKTWAGLSNMFKFQPLFDIRNYFGEYFAFYFAFCGHLLSSLWIPAFTGIAFFVVGVINKANTLKNDTSSTANLTSVSDLSSYYVNVFEDSFDTYLILPFACVICIWGIMTTSIWRHKQFNFAYEWDTLGYEAMELDRVQYTQKLQKYRINKNDPHAEFPKSEVFFKKFLSYFILLLMIGAVALEIALVVVYRVWSANYFSYNNTYVLIISQVGSSVIGAVFLLIMQQVYLQIAQCTTEWENPRTQTEFNDNLILKLFAFNFVNNYGSIYYQAFVRLFTFTDGYFGLGSTYSDTCASNCMRQVTLSIFINLLVTPLSRLFSVVIIPSIKSAYAKYALYRDLKNSSKTSEPSISFTNNVKPGQLSLRDFREYAFISAEQKKPDYESSFSNIPSKSNIRFEYMEKITFYGYIILFGASFSLGPLIFLLVLLFDIRIDAKIALWNFRRPASKQAQDIGMYESILVFLNIAGIVTNSFLIAFTSTYYKSYFSTWGTTYLLQLEYLFVIIYEHSFFLFWLLITLIPQRSTFENHKLQKEQKFVNEVVLGAKATANKFKNPSNTSVENGNNVSIPASVNPNVRQRGGNVSGNENESFNNDINYNNKPRDKIIPNNARVYPSDYNN